MSGSTSLKNSLQARISSDSFSKLNTWVPMMSAHFPRQNTFLIIGSSSPWF